MWRVMENPPGWFGEGGKVRAEAIDGAFAFLVVRHEDGRHSEGVFRLDGGRWRFLGGSDGVGGMLWVNDRSGSDLGVAATAGFSSSTTVTISFEDEVINVPVINGYYAWMRRDVRSPSER